VGNMTLKQFLKAAVGIILAILINSSKLMPIFKWPLMLFFGGSGLILAFVPFENRPLEAWIVSFIKSIYSPTIYIYKRIASKNWLDLDLTKKTEHNEEDLVKQNKTSFLKNKLETKNLNNEEKKQTESEIIKKNKIIIESSSNIKDNVKVEVKEELRIVDDWRNKETNLNLKSEKLNATGKVIFGKIPMPDISNRPNVIVGMATNNEGKIIDGIIVEIQDEHGNPSRVLKTNSLGQFKTTTPLANGRYLIISEKDGYNFDRVNIDLTGKIVQPIKIIANN
jgi:hypothetical protein